MIPTTPKDDLPRNGAWVLIEYKIGGITTAIYDNGMFLEGKAEYYPDAIRYWAYISDVKKALNWK